MSILKIVIEMLCSYSHQIFSYDIILYTGADDDATQVVDSSDHESKYFEADTL